jgi:O-antigen ligase
MMFVVVLLVARAAIRCNRLQPVNNLDVVVLLFMVGMLQSGFRGSRGIRSIQNIFDLYYVPILTYFAVKNLVTSRRSVHLVLYAVLCVALWSAVYAIYETATGNVLLARRTDRAYFYVDSGLRILRGIWGGNTDFGRVFVMAIPILFYLYLKAPSPFRKFLFATCLALVFGGLYLTYKRAAWVAMVAVVFVMQLFYPQFRRLFAVLLVVVAIAIALNWDSISTSTVYTDRVKSQYSTSDERTEGWEHALEFWSASPLVGHGFQQYRKLARAAGYWDQAIESEYLEILVSAGLVGFLPYIGLLLLMGFDGLQHYRGQVSDSLADRDLVAVFWGVLVGYAISISTSTVTNLAVPSLLFAVSGAIIYARREAVSTQWETRQGSTDPVTSTW